MAGRSIRATAERFSPEHESAGPIIYTLAIDEDDTGRPFVSREVLLQPSNRQSSNHSFTFLTFKKGRGVVWAGDGGVDVDAGGGVGKKHSALLNHAFSDKLGEREDVQLEDTRRQSWLIPDQTGASAPARDHLATSYPALENSPVSGSIVHSSPPAMSNQAPCRARRLRLSRIETNGKVRRFAIEFRIEARSSAV